jgi:alanine racemase
LPTPLSAIEESAGGRLTVDLDAIGRNYARLRDFAPASEVAGVVKADGYGLGAAAVARRLAAEGCTTFFVADMGEAVRLQDEARDSLGGAAIHVLNGVTEGGAEEMAARHLVPVLNTPADIAVWAATARRVGKRLPAAVHFDTGIHRLGLTEREMDAVLADPETLAPLDVTAWMSHLASADTPAAAQNADQLGRFRARAASLDTIGHAGKLSLANSPGILLGPDYHFDLVRPGIALYGGHPAPGNGGNPFEQVVTLEARILQVQELDAGEAVGYGATWSSGAPARIATVALGYADGYLRTASNRAWGMLAGTRVPVVGRISMDLVTLDVTAVPFAAARPGAYVTMLGPEVPIDDVADSAGTIGYEILTSLGGRYTRTYRGGSIAGDGGAERDARN